MVDLRNREVCLSWDPARSAVGDWSALCLLRLEDFTEIDLPVMRALGWSRWKGVHSEVQVERVAKIVERLWDRGISGAQILVDCGGDRSILDMLRSASTLTAGAVGIAIHGGEKPGFDRENRILRLPKQAMVGSLDAALTADTRRLVYSKDAPLVDAFLGEIADLRGTQLPSGGLRIAARAGGHDDLVMSTAQATYALTTGEQPIWTRATVGYWSSISDAPAGKYPDGAFTPTGSLDKPRPAALRYRWAS